MNKKIIFFTDMDMRGSGYSNLSVPLCTGLVDLGYDLKVIGLGYRGEEHHHPFGVIPAPNLMGAFSIIQNVYNLWRYDLLIVALDIPLQEKVLSKAQGRPFKYIGIFPIEADPLCFSWAMVLSQMDKAFVISKFGTDEAKKKGVEAEHIRIGIDTNKWKLRTDEDKKHLRNAFGFDDDTFIVLTVADNQERKNLSTAMEIFAEFAKEKNVRYIMVTREHNAVGWKLRDYAQELGIHNEIMIFERGITQEELWDIYAISDVFLLTAKAEGLCLPVLESMAVGIPVIGTDCTAVHELLTEGGGYPLEYNYVYRDPFGNGRRYLADRKHGTELLEKVYNLTMNNDKELTDLVAGARKYVEGRTWDTSISALDNAIKELLK